MMFVRHVIMTDRVSSQPKYWNYSDTCQGNVHKTYPHTVSIQVVDEGLFVNNEAYNEIEFGLKWDTGLALHLRTIETK